jgi:nicotinic acid mononucleotide adenylyltransferase
MRYVDDNDDDFIISYDSTVSLHQNIKEWQAVYGRMHMCTVVYERKVQSAIPSADARSSHMLTTFEIAADILNMTLSIQDL